MLRGYVARKSEGEGTKEGESRGRGKRAVFDAPHSRDRSFLHSIYIPACQWIVIFHPLESLTELREGSQIFNSARGVRETTKTLEISR
jgi:hypothetical protein